MKRIAGILLMMCVLCGCGPSVIVDGERYDALSEAEKRQLIDMAHTAFKRAPKAVSPAELAEIMREEPEIRIEYTGDRTGEARFLWNVSGRTIGIIFSGPLLEKEMMWILLTRPDPDRIIDYTKPENRPKP